MAKKVMLLLAIVILVFQVLPVNLAFADENTSSRGCDTWLEGISSNCKGNNCYFAGHYVPHYVITQHWIKRCYNNDGSVTSTRWNTVIYSGCC